MKDPILNDPGTEIDARSLIASAALRGALVGFCWSQLVVVPVALVNSIDPDVGPQKSLIMCGGICSIWAAVAAFAEVRRTRERTFTAAQEVILRYHIRNARFVAVGLIVIALIVLENVLPPVTVWAVIKFLAVVSIWFASSLVGRAQGYATVREMQRETRDATSRMNIHPLGVPNDTISMLLQPSRNRVTEARRRPDEAKSLAEWEGQD